MRVKPLHDVVIVELEEPPSVTRGGIILPDSVPKPLKVGRVLAVGPGVWKWNSRTGEEWFQKTIVQPGERAVFLTANLETGQGKQLCWALGDGLGLIRENDILFIIPEGEDIEVAI